MAVTGPAASAQVVQFREALDTIRVGGQTVFGGACTLEAMVMFASDAARGGGLFHEQCHAEEDKFLGGAVSEMTGGVFTGQPYIFRPNRMTSGPLAPVAWHHVAFVREGEQERFYLDGVLVDSAPWPDAMANDDCSGPARIGASRFGSYDINAPEVYIDWLRISTVARYSGALVTPPGCEPASDPGTVLLFRFNDAAGSTTALDSGPSAAHGTLGDGFPGASKPIFTSYPVIPETAAACTGAPVVLRFAVPAGGAAGAYQWRKDGDPISDGPTGSGSTLSGTSTAALMIDGATAADSGVYDVVVVDACGVWTSGGATVLACDVDYNCDGIVDFSDYLEFLNLFDAADPRADLNEDGIVDFSDYLEFLNLFDAGC
jgi:hypothetical protein